MAAMKLAAGESGLDVPGIVLREEPKVYLAAIAGRWLLSHSTPSWRAENPEMGFQRIVKEARAKEIARTVLDTRRTFPNAITLATNKKTFEVMGCNLHLPQTAKFLVVDGQHRLWAQKYSTVEGMYPCIIHMDRTEKQMAELFLEINDNQRRVPSPNSLAIALRPVNGDFAWQIAERNDVNYDMFNAWAAAKLFHGTFKPAKLTSLSGPLQLQFEASERLIRLALQFAIDVGLATNALEGCGQIGTGVQVRRRLGSQRPPQLVTQSAFQEF